MSIFKAFSALLSYPTDDFVAALDEIGAAIESERRSIPAAESVALRQLIDDLRGRDLYDLQESYVLLFDRTRALVAASVRACAWRKSRPWAGHGRFARALREQGPCRRS